LNGARFRGELVAPREGHSPGEAHVPHLVGEMPRDAGLESCGSRAAGEQLWSQVCSRDEEQEHLAAPELRGSRVAGEQLWFQVCSRDEERVCWAVLELRDSQEPYMTLRPCWPLQPRAR